MHPSHIRLCALALIALPTVALAGMELPVQGVVTSGVGWRLDPFGSGKLSYHRGIDIAVPEGTPVRATGKGKVVFAGLRRGYGWTVIVEHPQGERTLYGHNASVNVNSGETVEAGAVVAFSGNTGRSTGPHVHYERIASGRPAGEVEAATEVAAAKKDSGGRYLMEQKMEESLNSLLQTIRSGSAGQGG